MTVKWSTKAFTDLSATDLYNVAYERIRTFVIAQQRIYQEIDETDLVAHHIMGVQDGRLVAYARIFKEHEHVTFGRVLTIPEVRGQGLGRQLMSQIEAEIQRNYPGCPIQIEAQIDKQGFYQKFGYRESGPVFNFQGTPHIRMDKVAK
ncbi:GNAT family N-acetyltransferase [Levilactobacillus sp. HBUAS70063]|uniref:GNAT family N-acetyltransferase n=1 Tax=Levilactobacillus sp. HBUAS70063 TaxID=3109359 RepID=UPI0031329AD3